MDKRQVMKALLSQLEISYLEAKEEGVENLTLYKETYAKLAQISGRNVDYDTVVERGLKFATYGSIRSSVKIDAVISIVTKALSSKWASSEGRSDIAKKAVKTGSKRFAVSEDVYKDGVKILSDYKKALNAVDVLENEIVEDLKQKWMPPSDIVFEAVEMAKARDLGGEYVDEALEYMKNHASSLSDKDALRDALYEYFENIIDAEDEL